jgi:putative ABC transport system permease protein
MFTNFLKVTLRNLYREKMYAIINIFGLSLAIACCIILGLWLRSELTYDRHHTKYKQIFRVATEQKDPNNVSYTIALTSSLLGPMLAEEYPEIKGFVRFNNQLFDEELLIRHGDKAFYWKNIYYTDANIFDVFTHDIIYGDPKTALVDPTSCAVSRSFAKKYFGNANPIGETISTIWGKYKISLVFADLPENTHMKYDALFSFNDEKNQRHLSRDNLWFFTVYTYLLMPEGYNARAFKIIYDSFYASHMAEQGKAQNMMKRHWLQPLADIHLKSDIEKADMPTGNKLYLYAFTVVALFILLVACINYMNLATARAARRAKEVGMRKILGSGRARLILQFLGESILFSVIALFLGLVLVEIVLNLTPINELLGKSLTLNLSREPGLLVWMLVFSLGIGVTSGIYPAIYLSSMLPLSVLVKGNRAGKGSIRIREILVFIQFAVTVSVISCTLLMALQMRYVSHKSLGFNKENRLIITLRGANLFEKISIIKEELLQNSSILGISNSFNLIGQQSFSSSRSLIENNDGVIEESFLNSMLVGNDFLETMGLQLITGRDFSRKLLSNVGSSCIVNETLVRKIGWKEPLGKRIQLSGVSGEFEGRVIGVVKDFHFLSLHSLIDPIVLYQDEISTQNMSDKARELFQNYFILHISGEDIHGTINYLQEKFKKFDPEYTFEYEFLDDSLNKLYLSEQRAMDLIGVFAAVCILISCMGLFGVAAFTTEQRTKEIGIRKLIGATTWQIITMLSRRILLLVLGGAVIASLIAYYAMDEWLTGFAYRIGINPIVFFIAAAMAACVAFITVAMQSYRTARANPVEALRYE